MKSGTLIFSREAGQFTAGFGLLRQPLSELEGQLHLLHPEESKYYANLRFDRRKQSYLLGRLAGKLALKSLFPTVPSAEIWLDSGVFQFPIVRHPKLQNIQLSISHCGDLGLAIAFPEAHPLGIDIEVADPKKSEAMRSQLQPDELVQIAGCSCSEAEGMTVVWTMKEALSKIFRTGLTLDFGLLEIEELAEKDDYFQAIFRHAAQYKSVSIRLNDQVCTIVLPKKSMANFDPFHQALRQILQV